MSDPVSPAELNSMGVRMQYNLGRQIREEYVVGQNFLSANFDDREMKIYSTNTNRTIMSAYSHLMGIYSK